MYYINYVGHGWFTPPIPINLLVFFWLDSQTDSNASLLTKHLFFIFCFFIYFKLKEKKNINRHHISNHTAFILLLSHISLVCVCVCEPKNARRKRDGLRWKAKILETQYAMRWWFSSLLLRTNNIYLYSYILAFFALYVCIPTHLRIYCTCSLGLGSFFILSPF